MSQIMHILDVSGISQRILPRLHDLIHVHRLNQQDIERVFDWCIAESFHRLLQVRVQGHLSNHQSHDVYACIYDEIEYEIELAMNQLIYGNNLYFLKSDAIKLMTTYRDLIIVRSIFDGVI